MKLIVTIQRDDQPDEVREIGAGVFWLTNYIEPSEHHPWTLAVLPLSGPRASDIAHSFEETWTFSFSEGRRGFRIIRVRQGVGPWVDFDTIRSFFPSSQILLCVGGEIEVAILNRPDPCLEGFITNVLFKVVASEDI